jgi:predicted ATPase/class 3 adenylate cyclase
MPPKDRSPDRDLPTGTLTFLFTDIEGSTKLLSALGDAYEQVLEAHARIIRTEIAANGGTEVSTEGDAFFAVFPSALGAVRAAAGAQRALASNRWPNGVTVRVRMGLHTGDGRRGGDNYVGMDVHRAARIGAAGHGGQVLLSDATKALVAADLPDGLALRDLADHRLKDLPAPERIWQLDIAGLPSDHPAIRSLDARPGNLPSSPTPLIGREAALDAVAELVTRRPLVTLIGPGGTGKTRLGLAVAERLRRDFADGAFFVALQDALDRPAVASAIASTLGVRERPDRDLERGVIEHMRDRDVLLVLDNFEQAIGAAPLVSAMLAAAPRLRAIVTSRQVLHLSSEQTYEVPPLTMPDRSGPSGDLPPIEELLQYEAVALFVERARAVQPAFAITDANARAVVEICNRLDGLPLAVELAAARIRLLTPQAILDRLERRLPVLVGGAADLPARQRTLHGAIEWSHDLLAPSERRLFERLAVFAGGWSIEAAEAVCNSASELGLDTFDGLTSLADKSLIQPVPTSDGEARFVMLQVVREFATEKLDEGPDGAELRRRHAVYMCELAEAAGPELRSSSLRMWQHRLRREQENVRTALRWAIEEGDVDDGAREVGLRTAGAIWDYWHYWAELREGVQWLDALLSLPAAAQPTLVRTRALGALAGLVYWLGDSERAYARYQDALAINRELGDDRLIAGTLRDSAWAAIGLGDAELAARLAGESLELYGKAGDEAEVTLLRSWFQVAPVVMGLGGDLEQAAIAIDEAIEVNRRLGRLHEVADWLETRVLIYRTVGDFPKAAEAGRESLAVWHELGTIGRYPLGLKILAAVELELGRPERAARLGAAAERWNNEVGGELSEVIAHLGDPVEESRPLLDPAEHERAVTEGRKMDLEEQIAYALTEGVPAEHHVR